MGELSNPPHPSSITPQGDGSTLDADFLDGLTSTDFALAVTSEDEFTATAAQTAFTLSQTFQPGGISVVSINGVNYAQDTDYTISGLLLTWLNNDFILEAGDRVVAKYQRL